MGLMLAPIESTPYIGGNRPGFLSVSSGGTQQLVKSNLSAVAPPTSLDDSSAGYAVGSRWVDAAEGVVYECVDATPAAARWNGMLKHSAGKYGIGTTGAPETRLQLGDDTEGWVDATYGADLLSTVTSTGTTGSQNGILAEVVLNPGSASTREGAGLHGSVTVKAANAQNITGGGLLGVIGEANHFGSGNVSALTGLRAASTVWNPCTVTDLIGVDASFENQDTGTVTNGYGLRVRDIANVGTMANTYGVYIGDVTAGTQTNQAYGLYQADTGARNYFGGTVGIGVPVPASRLTILGNNSLEFSGVSAQNAPSYIKSGPNDNLFILPNQSLGKTCEIGNPAYSAFKVNSNSLSLFTGSTERVIVLNDGKVGIGTTTPGQLLDIFQSTGTPILQVRNSSGTTYLYTSSNGNSYVGAAGAKATHILGGGAERITALAGGNVGVGTTSPQANLDNNGSLKTVTAHFPAETSNAPTGTTQAVNWTTNNKQKLDVSGASGDVSVTFSSPPPGVTNLILKVVQGGTARDITWPAAVTWLGTEPVWNADTGKTRIVAIYYDGTTYWATASPTNT